MGRPLVSIGGTWANLEKFPLKISSQPCDIKDSVVSGWFEGNQERICLKCRRPGFHPWVRKIPWKREQLPTPVSLPGELHGQGAWQDTVHGIAKESDMIESLMLSLFHAKTLSSFIQQALLGNILAPGTKLGTGIEKQVRYGPAPEKLIVFLRRQMSRRTFPIHSSEC